MATATAAQTINRVFAPIQQFNRSWMLAETTGAYGLDLGFASSSHFWLVGRAGVLGACSDEVAASALAFQPLDRVRAAWHGVPETLTHYEVSLRYRDVLARRGDEVLGNFDPETIESIDEMGRRVIDAAPAALGGIFAGWRQVALPGSDAGRAALTIHVLRELRGAAHVTAILASGLTPLEAVLAATDPPPRTGPAYAELMGFVGPFRDPEEYRHQRIEAEELTKSMLERYFAVLSPDELAQFGNAVESAGAAAAAK